MAEIDKTQRIVSGKEFDDFREVKNGTKVSSIFNEKSGGGAMFKDDCGTAGHPKAQSFVGVHDGSDVFDKNGNKIVFPFSADEKLYAEIYAINENKKGTRIIVTNETAYMTYDKEDLSVDEGDEILTKKGALQASLNSGDGISITDPTDPGEVARTVNVKREENGGLTFVADGTLGGSTALTIDPSKVLRFAELSAKMPTGQACRLPYFFEVDYTDNKAIVKDYTVTLDGNYNVETFTLDINSATDTKAGLMNAHDKQLSIDVEKILKLDTKHESEGGINLQIPYKFDFTVSADKITVKDFTVALDESGKGIIYRDWSKDIPAATSSAAGLMKASDKVALDDLNGNIPHKGAIRLLNAPAPGVIAYHFPYDAELIKSANDIDLKVFTVTLDNNETKIPFSGKYTLTGATSTEAGLMTASDKVELGKLRTDLTIEKQDRIDQDTQLQKNIDTKTTEKIIDSGSTSYIFNEVDGGGAKFENADGTWSYVGVNNGGASGIDAQIYAVDKNTKVGTRINVKKDKIYYTKGKNNASVTDNDELVVKGDLIDPATGFIKLLGNEAGSGQPYHFPYNFNAEIIDSTTTTGRKSIKVSLDTITLDNNKTLVPFTKELELPELGKVDDVKVNGASVVTNKIADIDLTGKLDKLTGSAFAYVNNASGNPGKLEYKTDKYPNTIAIRDNDGKLYCADPTGPNHTVNKHYAENNFIKKLGKVPGVTPAEDFHLPYFALIKPNANDIKLDVYTVNINDGSVKTFNDNYTLPAATITTAGLMSASDKNKLDDTASGLSTETSNRSTADTNLQTQIDALVAKSDVVDVVPCYDYNNTTITPKPTRDLVHYDTAKLTLNDIVKVLDDETHGNSESYYIWTVVSPATTPSWSYIGSLGASYTKAQSDAKYIPFLGKATATEEYHIPFNINPFVYSEDKVSTTFDTITLDGNKTKVSYPIEITGATTSQAGLMSKADKVKLDKMLPDYPADATKEYILKIKYDTTNNKWIKEWVERVENIQYDVIG